jgi:hypothetical protein
MPFILGSHTPKLHSVQFLKEVVLFYPVRSVAFHQLQGSY